MAKSKVARDSSGEKQKVANCACRSPFQDSRYGTGRRLLNRKTEKGNTNWRCTVCGREQ